MLALVPKFDGDFHHSVPSPYFEINFKKGGGVFSCISISFSGTFQKSTEWTR